MPRQYFRRGDRLYGLAQSHIVADQGPAGSHREQRALGLIGIERRLQKRQQLGIGSAAREQLRELCRSPVRIPPSRDEIERVVIGAQLMTGLGRHGHEMLELAEALVGQHPVVFGVEQTGGGLRSAPAGNPFRRENARCVCRHCADTARKMRAGSRAQTPSWRRAFSTSRASVNSMCLQVPNSLVA